MTDAQGSGAGVGTREVILDAAQEFLVRRRLRDMTVSALMEPIPVTREAFKLRVAALLPAVEHRHHHPGRVRDLGADRTRPRHHPGLSEMAVHSKGMTRRTATALAGIGMVLSMSACASSAEAYQTAIDALRHVDRHHARGDRLKRSSVPDAD